MAKGYGSMPNMGGNNMNSLMKQAQKMQRQMEEMQQQLQTAEFTGTAGGGAVTVKVSGSKQVLSVAIAPSAVDPDDVEMLQDLVMAAVNEALRQVDSFQAGQMQGITGGFGGGAGFPGGLGGLF